MERARRRRGPLQLGDGGDPITFMLRELLDALLGERRPARALELRRGQVRFKLIPLLFCGRERGAVAEACCVRNRSVDRRDVAGRQRVQ